jgi:serine/threonine-protein kinase RsbW
MAHHSPAPQSSPAARVEVRLPAEGAYAAVLRTTAAALAARLDLTIEDIEDLRIAIGEATALVLPLADPGADLLCVFDLLESQVAVDLSVRSTGEPVVDRSSFAWQVLDTLASDATASAGAGRLSVSFTLHSELAEPPTGAGSSR